MKKQVRYVIKKHPNSVNNPWLIEHLHHHMDGMYGYRSLANSILCPEDLTPLKTFYAAETAAEYIKKDQEKPKKEQVCYSDSIVCKLEISVDSIKITAIDD